MVGFNVVGSVTSGGRCRRPAFRSGSGGATIRLRAANEQAGEFHRLPLSERCVDLSAERVSIRRTCLEPSPAALIHLASRTPNDTVAIKTRRNDADPHRR